MRQNAKDGTPLREVISEQGALPGIKVDKGISPLDSSPEENITGGLDGLNERCAEYFDLGAKFTKWRAVIKISDGLPSQAAIKANMDALADYAKIVQENNMVPIVEPEVLMDGDHNSEDCFRKTSEVLKRCYDELILNKVDLKGIILKPNMILAGNKSKDKISNEEVSKKTLECLKNLQSQIEVPGIAFLSGGQSEI